MRRVIFLLSVCFAVVLPMRAQLYSGMTGLLHVPSAEMDEEGDVRIGTYFLNRHFTPDAGFSIGGKRYDTMSFYMSATPFWWVELGYTFTLFKTPNHEGVPRYNGKDRYFSVKLAPIREGKYIPAVAIGANDVMTTVDKNDANAYFANYYMALTKHVCFRGNTLGVDLAYRRYRRDYNAKWDGVVGGLTFRPSFAPNLRVIAEYSGNEINVGADCMLWRHLFLQAMLQDGKYLSGGICFCANLF